MTLIPPNITPGEWFAVMDNPMSIVLGHTIKSDNTCKTPVGLAFKGVGASKKGITEQRANAKAFAALPKLLKALEGEYNQHRYDRQFFEGPELARLDGRLNAIRTALLAAGYTEAKE